MAVSPTSGSIMTLADLQAAAGSKDSSTDNSLNKGAFLKLMVAQMKYQDPLKPTDPQSFMTQTAQFTQVEKLEELTTAIASAGRTSALATASGLLGRTVTFALADGSKATGVVSGASPTADGITLTVGNRITTLDQISDIALGTTNG